MYKVTMSRKVAKSFNPDFIKRAIKELNPEYYNDGKTRQGKVMMEGQPPLILFYVCFEFEGEKTTMIKEAKYSR